MQAATRTRPRERSVAGQVVDVLEIAKNGDGRDAKSQEIRKTAVIRVNNHANSFVKDPYQIQWINFSTSIYFGVHLIHAPVDLIYF